MPDALSAALAAEGAVWLLAAALLAGLVRGFAGFGTALVFMPVAAMFLPPPVAVATVVVMDMIGPLPNLPRALRQAARPEVARMVAGMLLGLVPGLWLLTRIDAEPFRWALSAVSLVFLAVLVSGWRYRGPREGAWPVVAGAAGGVLGGATGLVGPPVILWSMASPLPAAVVRANMLVFLVAVDLAMLALLGRGGQITGAVLVGGLLLAGPFLLANIAGAAMFRPGAERAYRACAYTIIAGAALAGLPVWS